MPYYQNLAELPKRFGAVHLVLGDQLHAGHSWFQTRNDDVLFVIMEMRQETDYVVHHRQKVLAFFAAMRAFAKAISSKHHVLYLTLAHADNTQSLERNLKRICTHVHAQQFAYQQPDEYRLTQQLTALSEELKQQQPALKCYCASTEHFFTEIDDLVRYFPKLIQQPHTNLMMETFYRQVRKETGYLMEHGKPAGGKWNFDQDNRNKLPKTVSIPEPLLFSHDVRDIDAMLSEQGIKTIGNVDAKRLLWPITRTQSRELLDHFIEYCLPAFGQYQDALTTRGWSLFHARISFSLNSKMLTPKEVIEKAIAHYVKHQDESDPAHISLPQIEGFVRQILGWREYVRLIYWHFMPNYAAQNQLQHERSLPAFYWTGNTKMRCVSHAVHQSLDFAYAHHIQRLMVTGNFALLAGCAPDAVDQWYMGIYIDAIEWVELPNTRGMSQFADGGILATKPYVSSGNYIHKMSDYCNSCYYSVALKSGTGNNTPSCPFNSLYWHFIHRHRERFAHNPRMAMMYRQWEKREVSERDDILATAEHYLAHIEEL
ncbi:cryptochrome/photolyase family protein [Aliidiomarina celeris]|uniref:cryptochrome/photolyase family protein n=1 Tax=Aliidiomarina celeris TaxID=2249428 RepID=UPI000DEA50D6|nr:cryptochrome/photolyase family protein [Aliidiomarina celeris]